ncbi:hypothetical protein E2562_012477 [Oryza meyeriana var. granulata]|uniref:FAD-binding PCMH-type domain-containing protein n=1 Tax=Oryza meyeriana var. granulata TaxID=110450 RepID=A0A6G1BUH5_9ORYZ|nr:hypothetical protein E2562_012477 [Oryza meyeriana var. granulata]
MDDDRRARVWSWRRTGCRTGWRRSSEISYARHHPSVSWPPRRLALVDGVCRRPALQRRSGLAAGVPPRLRRRQRLPRQLLNFSIQNLRFKLPALGVPRPAAVELPGSRSELQRAVLCARDASLRIRVRSCGNSYEGLSYTVDDDGARVRFVVIDLMRMNRVRVDAALATAWVESGPTLGELYYAVAAASSSRSNGSPSRLGRARPS